MNEKCQHCPLLAEARACPGERNRRVCQRADPESDIHDPGILKKIAGFAKAVLKHVGAGRPMATEEQKAARLARCRACEHYDDGRCRLCGCGLDMKAGWADQGCPAGKWSPIAPEAIEPAPVQPVETVPAEAASA